MDDNAPQGEEDSDEPSFSVTVNVLIEKPGKGCMYVETTAQDGMIAIENVNYYKKGELAEPQTAELNWSKRNLYAGPPFGNLDEELQVLLERYLDERGINTALALFVPDYVDFKEQREYLSWLSSEFPPHFKPETVPLLIQSRSEIVCRCITRPRSISAPFSLSTTSPVDSHSERHITFTLYFIKDLKIFSDIMYEHPSESQAIPP